LGRDLRGWNEGGESYYRQPLLVESFGSSLGGKVTVKINLKGHFEVDIGGEYGVVEVTVNVQGNKLFVGRLQIARPVILAKVDNFLIEKADDA
jgi:hypothetical protein